MKKILVVGNALVDRLYQNIPDSLLSTLGLCRGTMTLITEEQDAHLRQLVADTVPFVNCDMATGGSAANTALALAHQGGSADFIGMIGHDEEGAFFTRTLVEAGVRACLLTDSAERTGVAHTFISPDGERTFATCLGAANTMATDLITTELLAGRDLLYLEGYLVQNHALVLRLLREADRLGMEIALDLSSYNIVAQDRDFFRQVLSDYVDIVFANEQEALAFAFPDRDMERFDDEAVETAACMLGRICRIAVVKRGARGSIYVDADVHGTCDACHVPASEVVDTTAAGDFFAAGFLYCYVNGEPTDECMRRASRLSAEVIKVVGSHLAEETWQKLCPRE